jgi:multidrug resistance efflux pump
MSRARDRRPRLVERDVEPLRERPSKEPGEVPRPEPAFMPADERRFLRVLTDGARARLVGSVRLLRSHLRDGRGLRLLIGAAIVIVLLPIVLWIRYKLLYVESQNATVKGYITDMGAQLDGVVTTVEVDAGQPVRAGQELARFEDHQLQANAQRARSQLDKASRTLEVERLAIEQERLRLTGLEQQAGARTAAAGAQAEAARSESEDAQTKFEQSKSLADAGAIPQDQLRVAETNLRTLVAKEQSAHADQKAAESAEHLAAIETQGLSVRRRNLAVLEAEVAAFRAELELAEADLRAARIVAPADGWVVRRIAEPGTSVVVGQPIVSLWVGPEVWVEAWIDEQDLARVAPGSEVRVTVKPYPRRVILGEVETVGVSTDYEMPETVVPQPRTTRLRASPVVCVRVRLKQPEGLFPGLSAVVAIRKSGAGALAATAPHPPVGAAAAPMPATMPAATPARAPAAGASR